MTNVARPTRIAVFILLILTWSCGPHPDWPGRYDAPIPENGTETVVLKLADGGKGSWTTPDGSVEFRWEARQDQLRLHMPAGGVVIGQRGADQSIRIQLPAIGDFDFRKTGP